MTFMQSLANSPGGSGIYGQPGSSGDNTGEVLDLVNRLKDREMRDFKDKANFMADLSVKQSRIRNLYDPGPQGPSGLVDSLPGRGMAEPGTGQPMNTVMAQDPNQITPYQKGELGIRQQGLNLESQRINQQGKLGQEAIDVKTAQEKLNQEKSNQINAQKTADMERKINESAERIRVADERLKQAGTNAAAALKAHKELADAIEERHKLELAQKQHQFDVTSGQHEETIKSLQKKLEQSGRSKTTTEINPEGTKKTTTTERGDEPPPGRVWGIGKDGSRHPVPIDKIDDWNENHALAGTEIKKPGGEEE